MRREERLPFIGGVLVGLIIALVTALVSAIITALGSTRPFAVEHNECDGIAAGQVWEYTGRPENPFGGATLSFRSKVLDVKGRYIKYEILPGGSLPPGVESEKCSWYLIDSELLP